MSAVRGRRDDMLIIRGVNLYPSQIEHVLLAQPGVAPHYQLVVERPETLDEVTVCCEPVEAGTNPIALADRRSSRRSASGSASPSPSTSRRRARSRAARARPCG